MSKFFFSLLLIFFVLPVNAEPKVYAHYLCQETRAGEPAGVVDFYIASGLDYPGASRGIRVSSASGSREFRIREAKEVKNGNYVFDLTNGGSLELSTQKWRSKVVGKGAITLHLPGEPSEIYDNCEVDSREVGFTVGN